jgi:phosphoketolase
MAVLNDIDRFHLALDVIERVAKVQTDTKATKHRHSNALQTNSSNLRLSDVVSISMSIQLSSAAHVAQELRDKLVSHKQYIQEYGIDMPGKTMGDGVLVWFFP